jgi:hypoxanthine phosphoribosyltransferase
MKVYINQVQFNTHLLRLLEKLNGKMDDFDVVLGIKNGGLNVSLPISDFFSKPHWDIHISFYDGDQRLTEPFVDKDKLDIYRKKWNFNKLLWVDDIIDSGSTLRWFINNTGLKKGVDFSVASIHWCEDNSPDLEPEFFVNKKSKLDWVVYPWEIDNE